MRGIVAKRLRREVYGDRSLKNKKTYKKLVKTGQIICTDSDRIDYQLAKKLYKRGELK